MIANAGASGNYAAYPDIYEQRCYASKNHDSADLCAQWRAALAAEKAADAADWGTRIAVIGTVLSFISTILVLFALHQTAEANEQTRDHFEKDSRPYVFLECDRDCISTDENGQKSIIWKFKLTNHGRTPAVLDSLQGVLSKGRNEPSHPRLTLEPWGADNILAPGGSKCYQRRLDGRITTNSTLWLVTQLRYRNSAETHFITDTQLKYHKGKVTFENEKRSYRT